MTARSAILLASSVAFDTRFLCRSHADGYCAIGHLIAAPMNHVEAIYIAFCEDIFNGCVWNMVVYLQQKCRKQLFHVKLAPHYHTIRFKHVPPECVWLTLSYVLCGCDLRLSKRSRVFNKHQSKCLSSYYESRIPKLLKKFNELLTVISIRTYT